MKYQDFCNLAQKACLNPQRIIENDSMHWNDMTAPEGIIPGTSQFISNQNKTIIIGSEKPWSVEPASPLPCGLFVGTCEDILSCIPGIEEQVYSHYPVLSDGTWNDQRPFFRTVYENILQGGGSHPALAYVVPFWVSLENPQGERPESLRKPELKTLLLDPTKGGYIGIPTSRPNPGWLVSSKTLGSLRLRALSGEARYKELKPYSMIRTRRRLDGSIFTRDQIVALGAGDDPNFIERGWVKATTECTGYLRGNDGESWRVYAYWVFVVASFISSDYVMCSFRPMNPCDMETHDHTTVLMAYDKFWSSIHGLNDALAPIKRKIQGR